MTPKSFIKSKKFWKRFLIALVLIPLLLLSAGVGLVYVKQDDIVQSLIGTLNKDFKGRIELKDSHISPFENFPYVSIDLEGVKIFEGKEDSSFVIADINEVFLGFEVSSLFGKSLDINDIKLKDGKIDLVQHLDGSFNIENALSSEKEVENASEEFHLAIHEIELENVDIHKLNEENKILIDALIYEADAKFETTSDKLLVHFDSKFELNLIEDGDTSFIKHKHFDLDTELEYNSESEVLVLQPTTIHLENSSFETEGSVDFKDDMNLDFKIAGNKENYDLILAMAPEELIPTLKKYDNRGRIFFETSIKGKSIHGNMPAINATFGCENGFFKNTEKNKEVNDLNFHGSFTNGKDRNLSTSKLVLSDFSAQPEEGKLQAKLEITNFSDPEVDFKINTSFELNFLAQFFNLTEIEDLSGAVELELNFHDIVNIDAPQHTIEKLNESYESRLKVTDLKFKYGKNSIPVDDLDLLINMDGHVAKIDHFNLNMGNSDLKLKGSISDLPAVIHHTNAPIYTQLAVSSNKIDLFELTGADSNAVNEQINNLKTQVKFKCKANEFTEFKNLPQGEFIIENLYAKLNNYPHKLHDFHLDVFVDNENFKVLDFKGEIDKSDFLFSGKLKHYDIWFADSINGETEIDFNFNSNHLRLEDLLVYNGENYVPKDYRHEELDDFKFHGNTKLNFQNALKSVDFTLDHFKAKMKIHPLKFKDVKANLHYEDHQLSVNNFQGSLGNSDFKMSLHYYLDKDESLKKKDNSFSLVSNNLNIDQLTNFNLKPKNKTENHDSIFNIYKLPFSDMKFDVKVGKLVYQDHKVSNLTTRLRTTPNHYIYIDTLTVNVAGGRVATNGYFNGSNPDLIYFSPNLKVENIDIDQIFMKFDNFGQDHLISENLHGKLWGKVTGKIHLHTDMVPKIDDSEIHMDMHIENGRLENYAMLDSFADYFANQNLEVVKFDTLDNHIDMVNGVVTIPKMTLNSTLGFFEVSGTQNTDTKFEYRISVPLKLVTKAVKNKLFKKRKGKKEQQDEIQYAKKNTKYVSILLKGDSEDFSVSLTKRKKKKK